MNEASINNVQFLRVILAHRLGHIQDLHLHGTLAELDLQDISGLHAQGRLGRPAVYQDASRVAGLVGDGSALNQARNLQKLVKSHKLMRLPCPLMLFRL